MLFKTERQNRAGPSRKSLQPAVDPPQLTVFESGLPDVPAKRAGNPGCRASRTQVWRRLVRHTSRYWPRARLGNRDRLMSRGPRRPACPPHHGPGSARALRAFFSPGRRNPPAYTSSASSTSGPARPRPRLASDWAGRGENRRRRSCIYMIYEPPGPRLIPSPFANAGQERLLESARARPGRLNPGTRASLPPRRAPQRANPRLLPPYKEERFHLGPSPASILVLLQKNRRAQPNRRTRQWPKRIRPHYNLHRYRGAGECLRQRPGAAACRQRRPETWWLPPPEYAVKWFENRTTEPGLSWVTSGPSPYELASV